MGTNELDQSFPGGRFTHHTWANVSELSILEFTNVKRIESGFLNGLEQLKFLSVSSCTDLDTIHKDTFSSTPNIEELHLDGNTLLKLYIVETALIDKLSNLRFLSLIAIQGLQNHVVLGEYFSKALLRKNLTSLDISRVNVIYVEHATAQDVFGNLKYLNLSYSTILLPDVMNDIYRRLIPNIELLDLTGVQYFVWYNKIEGEWILFTNIDIINKTVLSCKYGNNEEFLNIELFQMVQQHCRLASIIGIGVASSIAIIISIFTFAITIRLRRKSDRRNRDLENLKKEILQENTNFEFLIFLSYCSRDAQIVEENILPSLNRYLHETFNTERDIVCTGESDFVPGMRIIEEIHRCIDKSLVVVPVITPEFLQSDWSQEECVAAVERHRQVVILMKKHTDTSRAIVTIQILLGQYTRGTWSDNEGVFVIRPSWNIICEGIIRAASEALRHYRRNNFIEPAEDNPLVEDIV